MLRHVKNKGRHANIWIIEISENFLNNMFWELKINLKNCRQRSLKACRREQRRPMPRKMIFKNTGF